VNSSGSESSYKTNPAASSNTSVSVNQSSVRFNLYSGGPSSPWAGEGDYYVFFEDSQTGHLAAKSGQIPFLNGSASNVNAGNFTVMGLVITNISSGQYGTYRVYVNSSGSESSYKTNPAASNISALINHAAVRVDLNQENSSARWTGTGSYYVFLENNRGQLAFKSARVSFSNGSLIISAKDFTETTGRLTITGIDSGLYGTYRVYVNSSGSESGYGTDPEASNSSVSISGPTVTVDLYRDGSSSPWTETESYYVFFEGSGGQLIAKSGPIYFTNGNATIAASSLDVTGRLTITGIGSGLYGTYRVYVNDVDDESAYWYGPAASRASVSISGSTAVVDLYTDGFSIRWTDTGSYYVFLEDNSGDQLIAKSGPIYFSGGTATLYYSEFSAISP
jgi:hypothetical protein